MLVNKYDSLGGITFKTTLRGKCLVFSLLAKRHNERRNGLLIETNDKSLH